MLPIFWHLLPLQFEEQNHILAFFSYYHGAVCGYREMYLKSAKLYLVQNTVVYKWLVIQIWAPVSIQQLQYHLGLHKTLFWLSYIKLQSLIFNWGQIWVISYFFGQVFWMETFSRPFWRIVSLKTMSKFFPTFIFQLLPRSSWCFVSIRHRQTFDIRERW